jgi:MFS transporter, ACS family, glucarate transporter
MKQPVGRLRYGIVAMLFAVTIINYGDRAILAIVAPLMREDLGLNALQLGIVFSAFGWAYVAAQIPGGWLLDRFGSMRVYLWSLVTWSLMTAAQGFLPWLAGFTAITWLFIFRFLVGLAEAPSFPGNARIAAAWFPATERATATSIFNSAQYFATVLFAPLLAWIATTFGWPAAFWFMGGIGVLAALIWTRVMYDPLRHPKLSAAELQLIRDGGGMPDMDAPQQRRAQSWQAVRALLSNRTTLGMYVGQYAINTLTYFFITWFPVYLVQERGLTLIRAGIYATLPALCGFVGGILGGIWSDWLLRHGKSLTVARKTPIVLGMLLSIAIIGCNYVEQPLWVMVFMSLAFFGKGIGALGWAVMADTAPRGLAGLSGGIFNTFGNLSSIVTPIVVGALVQFTGSFQSALVFIAANALLAAAAYLFIVGEIRRIELPATTGDRS